MAVTTIDSIEYIESQLDEAERLQKSLIREVERIEELRLYWRKRLEAAQETA